MQDGPRTSLQARIQGRVQGVGFRFFVLREARGLGLTGTVANRPDGSVEVKAAGGREALEELLGRLRRGPTLSRVDHVEVQWDIPLPDMSEFTIEF
ncbi:MAG TPA: acylphosphatase [Candidatus Sumerlaeota bacterium]|nr:MAG: Acylphosphatase [candidate division BRC1 bacterium ADurb.BinA292]HOE97904.1 acylphosphatase [Candidatus Sumerlaeota bacterium]HOR27310.1 acylphosphatase [Candidatus Sumerlaeota bacterium]HPK01563.1 acylphosphatase [Candidatus Sumerlaeota bacterium]